MALSKIDSVALGANAVANSIGYQPMGNTSGSISTALGYTPMGNSSGSVTGALGFTPANKAGDTITGATTFSNTVSVTGAATFSNTLVFSDSTTMGTAPVGFKNRIINGDFRIWQRGTSFTSVASGQYTADRWQLSYRTAGVTIAQQNNTTYYAARLTNTDASVQSFDFEQRIEDVTQFNNAVFMLSFYAKSSTNVTCNMNCYVNYGSGGSAQDTANYTSAFSVTTTRTKFTIPITFPNMAAKTIGSSNYVRLLFTPVNLPASAWVEFDSIQLEPGSTATPFEFRPQGLELKMCMRYYERMEAQTQFWVPNSSYLSYAINLWQFRVPKRATATVSAISGASLGMDRFGIGPPTITGSGIDSPSQYSARANVTFNTNYTCGEGITLQTTYWQASAEL